MKYLYISYDAILELAAVHRLQNSDFDEAHELCNVLRGSIDKWNLGQIQYLKVSKGGYFFTKKPNLKKGVVFDYATFDGFTTAKDDALITIFQKIIKFSIRYFENLPPSSCEKHISGTNTSLVFPFPFIATKESYRVLIDKNSENKRLEKRDMRFLLVYASGYREIEGKVANFQNFNKAIDEASNIFTAISPLITAETHTEIDSLKLTRLGDDIELSLNSSIGFENWKQYLTNTQKKFILKPVNGPERLEGAAGTGKTLSLILRSIYLLQLHEEKQEDCHIIFITHSLATKKQIIEIFKSNLSDIDKYFDKSHSSISITIITLQEWCIKFLGSSIGGTEYLDKDAQDSKILQKMYLDDAFSKCLNEDFKTYKNFCSKEFISFIETTDRDELLEMLQHEVSVTIKGRANEKLEKYKALPRLKYSIPCKKEGDLNYIFLIFRKYQESLQKVNQFDSDDIVLTALGQLDTPIWRRRREKDGYDVVFVDETHLFNLNELSIIHNLAKNSNKNNIIFTLDRSQAVGDRGLVDDALHEALALQNFEDNIPQRLDTIFRSSPEIINVAFNILASGATLFTNFENPIDKISSNFIEKEGKRSINPKYLLKENEEEMIIESFRNAEKLKKELNTQNSRILIVATSEILFDKLEKFANSNNKPVEFLKSRGDIETINLASKNNRFLLAGIDYVGGLEFDAVIICGVDKGRVPSNSTEDYSEAFHFANYAWHNRMYVAVTRAKYAVVFLGEKTRGISPLLESSIENCVLEFD